MAKKNIDTEENVVNTDVSEIVEESTRRPIKAKDVDPEDYVTVRNGFQGRLVYRSPRTGEKFVWSRFGSEQDMQLRELKSAKNSAKKYFQNNWFMFDEPWVVEYLGLGRFYKNAISIEDFDKLFTMKPEAIKKAIVDMTKAQKRSVSYRARQLIANEQIENLKVIRALEESLGVELIEH